ELPEGNYFISTQKSYPGDAQNDGSCIDIVIESKELVCFIEVKVNSTENPGRSHNSGQLSKYVHVLNRLNARGTETHLRYLTKNGESKKIKDHHFRQFRWYQVWKFFKQLENQPMVSDFLHFLKSQDMGQELTITAKDLIAIENTQKVLNLMQEYLNRTENDFRDTFNKKLLSNASGIKYNQIKAHNRVINIIEGILGEGGWTEIKYGFVLGQTAIYTGIWVDKANTEYNSFVKAIESLPEEFIRIEHPKGIALELAASLGNYLNNENADVEIVRWFKNSFLKFAEFIRNNRQLDWKICLGSVSGSSSVL